MSSPENQPAFPCEAQIDRSAPEHDYIQTGIYSAKFPGMTLRDWLAGKALAWIAPTEINQHNKALPAAEAYAIADAMLAERERAA